jgi:hypothetical protein
MLKRVLKILIGIELIYLILANGALQLQLTQDLVNKIRPERFTVTWERAWTWYPFRVHAEKVFANGQARTQQWEVTASSASGSISILPLILKHVYLSDVQAENIDYRQRPRLKPGIDYSARLAFFPEIKDRKILPADTAELADKRPWKIHMKGLAASGEHRFWIHNLRGTASGPARGNLYTETRRGAFWLDVEQFDLNLGPAFLNGTAEAFHGGTAAGSLGFAPLVRAENPGRRMLRFGYLDADLDLAVDNLDFINVLTGHLGNFSVNGAGQVQGHLSISQGFVRAGTQLSVTTENLGVAMYDINFLGKGVVNIHTPEIQDTPLGLDVQYAQLTATRGPEPAPFLTGESLSLEYRGSNFITPDPGLGLAGLWSDQEARQRRASNSLTLSVDRATVPDMSALNYHLPSETTVQFAGGTTELNAEIVFGEESILGTINLDSVATQVKVGDQQLKADLDVDLNLAGGNPRTFTADFSGSTLRLFNVYVDGEREKFEGDYWSTTLEFISGGGTFARPVALAAESLITVSDTRPLVALFKNRSRTPKWLSNMMSVKNLGGEAEMTLSEGILRVPLAYVDSEKAEVGIKATFYEGEREGMVYARYKKVDTLVKRFNGKRDVDIIKSRKKFEEYVLP